MSIFICPVCGGLLSEKGKSLYCPKHHCFDKAKSGYTNLLPVHKTHSKAPGDNKLMVDGRSAFLNQGYYRPLRDALCQAVLDAAEVLRKDALPPEEQDAYRKAPGDKPDALYNSIEEEVPPVLKGLGIIPDALDISKGLELADRQSIPEKMNVPDGLDGSNALRNPEGLTVSSAIETSGRARSRQQKITLLDAGCGEGYYTQGMAETLEASSVPARVYGVDISKVAVDAAAKRTKAAAFAVASIFSLPVANGSCGILTEVFAPFCRDEFHRVLSQSGFMILAIPAKDHLLELKQAVYEHPYENEVKPYEIDGFTLEAKVEVRDRIRLDSGEDIRNLFAMTPYYYKTSREDTERLLALNTLETAISFEVLSYRKQ